MKKTKLVLLSIAVVSTILGSTFTAVLLKPSTGAPSPSLFSYTAKWICNIPTPPKPLDPNAAEQIGLVPGEYKTDINVHNPSFSSTNVTIKKKFVVSLPEPPTRQGGIVTRGPTAFASVLLFPDASFFIDCNDIFSVYAANGIALVPPVKGFVVLITTTPNLNVVAEYSSESFNATSTCTPPVCGSTGISLDLESITAAPFVP